MSEEHNMDETAKTENGRVNRRRFVRSLGAVGGAAIAGGMGIGQVSANPSSENKSTIEILDDEHNEERLTSIAKGDPELRKIQDYIIETYKLQVQEDSTHVFKKTDKDSKDAQKTFVVSFNTESIDESGRDWQGDVSVKIENGSTLGAFGVVHQIENEQGELTAISVGEDGISTDQTGINMDKDQPITKARNQGVVTTQGNLECSVCKDLLAVLCTGTCEATASFYCILAGVTTGPGGAICAGISLVACTYIERHGCSNVYESDCSYMGYC